MPTQSVLLLAHGGPNSLNDVPAFLREVRGGQPVPPPVIEETLRRYQLIGGRSPLLEITQRLASRLQNKIGLPVYVGMKHWHPFIADTVQKMVRDGIQHTLAICLAPHYSPLSIGTYRTKLAEVAQTLTFDFLESWHTHPAYIAAVAHHLQATLAHLPQETKIIFTAHSLPVSAREPYASQLHETTQRVAQNLGLSDDQWMLAYQSKPRASGEWLGPQIETLVPQLAREGVKHLLVAPIGFVTEHIEVLYDIDIALQAIAQANKVRLVRIPMLNDSDAMVNILAELVSNNARNT